ncbi:hypothetical protein L6475_03045 [Prevotella sp. E9-3]|uniref:hypothetical protein n=1 Tax=Prevotella sp. E9-3 TaxID=2913621 RepID=UPI001ED9EF32|nr:hypothetical protein [Prevotella sp. E9-3]UKK48958.1 hypothetical protein L6475_03045 [Prevotella sp. E9-3]
MRQLNENGKKYYGDWQWGDTIRQQLQGPIGNGAIDYPNGDRFEGFFHLSYAHINGPAYTASGKYKFKDGSEVPDCWIDGNDQLMGIYRWKDAQGLKRITMWVCGVKWGIEIIEGEKPVAIEYCNGKEVQRWESEVTYEFNNDSTDTSRMEILLPNGIRIRQWGGKAECDVSFPSCVVYYKNGDSFSHYGRSTRLLQPWNGYGTYHRASDGKMLKGEWKEGKQTDEKAEWEYDPQGAKRMELETDPYGNKLTEEVLVWADRIEYDYKKVYEGEIKDGRPEGKGIYTDADSVDYGEEPRRYEGEFHNGLCHGHGIYTYPSAGIRQEGSWANGKFLDSEAPDGPIMLHVHWTDDEWSMGGGSKVERKKFDIEAKVGELDIQGFRSVRIEEIRPNAIVFKEYDCPSRILTPGESIHFSNSIDGYEDHDGCVWDGDDYDMTVSWMSEE